MVAWVTALPQVRVRSLLFLVAYIGLAMPGRLPWSYRTRSAEAVRDPDGTGPRYTFGTHEDGKSGSARGISGHHRS
jgi:hypothetical protein